MMLRAEINDEQRIAYGRQRAQLDEDMEKLVEEKRQATADIRQRANTIKTQAREVSRAIRTGQEVREVQCFYRFKWKDGVKELIRTDTNEVVERRAITAEERQTVMNLGDSAAEQAVLQMTIEENPRRFIDLEE